MGRALLIVSRCITGIATSSEAGRSQAAMSKQQAISKSDCLILFMRSGYLFCPPGTTISGVN
jgi:hypothetical protein